MQIPVDFLHWFLAFLPIVALAFLLIQLRWTAQQAGAAGIFIAAAVAFFIFKAPLETLAVAGAKGVWDAMFILLVIWPALLLYQIMNQAGGYDALRQGITRMSRNELFIIVALGWVFASFLQGIDGFGTPIAVVAPLLVAFGVRPIYAVAIPIIAHIWAKFFGTLGVGWLATLQVVDLDEATTIATAYQSGLLIIIQAVLGGFTVVWLYGRWPAIRHAWPLVLIIAAIQGVGQIIVALMDPVLAAFIPATAAMLALYPLSRWPRYANPANDIVDRPAMLASHAGDYADKAPPMGLGMSFFPYILLTVLALGTSMIDPIKNALGSFTFGFPFPKVTTGYGITNAAATPYSALAPLTHPGASLIVTALVTWGLYKARGYYNAWAITAKAKQKGVLRGLFESAVPASVPILAFLVMAGLMNHSGQNETLALGISAIAPAYAFAFLSNGIGVIGAFTTSSSTSSNVLFSDLQVTLARLKGLPEATILAAQSAGGAIGNAIAPANVVMGASTAGISGQEGAILRKTLPWTLAAFLLTGAATVLLVLLAK
ncbi:L-lactate permease [Afipia birgiae]|jgi:lactate permease|uniref:L-lactate permease n=1 Tax=Afipia birgiae TaxID=151414 RepID=UPI0002DD6A98|nr:L-lactate permease [Afipia birgiae]MBX9819113.1 L-lactate permease [Afipia birgiae]